MKIVEDIKEFKRLAYEEAELLIKHATKEERGQLRITQVNPDNIYDCIYGQMTGNCISARAVELIQKCAKRVFIPSEESEKALSEACVLNGSPKKMPRGGDYWEEFNYFSPIEVFIMKGNKKEVVDLARYIKTGKKG